MHYHAHVQRADLALSSGKQEWDMYVILTTTTTTTTTTDKHAVS